MHIASKYGCLSEPKASWSTFCNKTANKTGSMLLSIAEFSSAEYTLSTNAGACLSPKDELAQEHERIRHVYSGRKFSYDNT